jgi:hypothetical protein
MATVEEHLWVEEEATAMAVVHGSVVGVGIGDQD